MAVTAGVQAALTLVVSVEEAATIIGCNESRVRQLLGSGDLSGQKLNARAWVVSRESAERYAAEPQRTGRPRNNEPRRAKSRKGGRSA